jgi:hypothetical protein
LLAFRDGPGQDVVTASFEHMAAGECTGLTPLDPGQPQIVAFPAMVAPGGCLDSAVDGTGALAVGTAADGRESAGHFLFPPGDGGPGSTRDYTVALEWTDIDFRRSFLHVNRAEWEGHIGTPKGGHARTVNMTSRLAAALKAHRHPEGSARALQRRRKHGGPRCAFELD